MRWILLAFLVLPVLGCEEEEEEGGAARIEPVDIGFIWAGAGPGESRDGGDVWKPSGCEEPADQCGYVVRDTGYNRQRECAVEYLLWFLCERKVCDGKEWYCDSGGGRGEPCFWLGQCRPTNAACGDLGCLTEH